MVKRLLRGFIIFGLTCICFSINVYAADKQVSHSLQYEIKEGSLYYESSWGFGTGRYGKVEQENKYTDIPCVVGINGYSFLNENGYVIMSDYIEGEADIEIPAAPENSVSLWLHFSGAIYKNGWTDSENLIKVSSKSEISDKSKNKELLLEDILKPTCKNENALKKTSDEVVQQIETIDEYSDIAIVVDTSGSMNDNQQQVINQLKTIELDDDTSILVFADSYATVSYEELVGLNYYVGSATELYKALNYIARQEVDTVILISDMQANGFIDLVEDSKVKNIIIYNPDSYELSQDAIQRIKSMWTANVVTYTIK